MKYEKTWKEIVGNVACIEYVNECKYAGVCG